MTTLLQDIELFLRESGMSASRFGLRAVNNSRLVERLRLGRPIWPNTEQRVRVFILVERQRRGLAKGDVQNAETVAPMELVP